MRVLPPLLNRPLAGPSRHRRRVARCSASCLGARGAVVAAILVALVVSGCAWGDATPASEVTDTTATLNGNVGSYANGTVHYWFEYGLTTAYGNETPRQSLDVSRDGTYPVSESVTGLEPATTYQLQALRPAPRSPRSVVLQDRLSHYRPDARSWADGARDLGGAHAVPGLRPRGERLCNTLYGRSGHGLGRGPNWHGGGDRWPCGPGRALHRERDPCCCPSALPSPPPSTARAAPTTCAACRPASPPGAFLDPVPRARTGRSSPPDM